MRDLRGLPDCRLTECYNGGDEQLRDEVATERQRRARQQVTEDDARLRRISDPRGSIANLVITDMRRMVALSILPLGLVEAEIRRRYEVRRPALALWRGPKVKAG